ncbi:alpha/beta hydrolase, partial [Burkholderia cenocepacia]|nr:alpha/beta hydrolase [Burkholderia cenocepacia]
MRPPTRGRSHADDRHMTDILTEETTVETPQGRLFAKRWRAGPAQAPPRAAPAPHAS